MLAADASEDALGLGKMFTDPNLFAKLAANPRTAKHLADPNFAQMVRFILHAIDYFLKTGFVASNDSEESRFS